MPERHELFKFMQQISHDMTSEYERIVKRAVEDPGTAGDEGEELWAELFRNWLPSTYHIVTKGRILFEDDTASPQIDILVLCPDYPIHLRNKKMYFAGGVIAAFECKLTLRVNHFRKFFKTSEIIKSKTLFGKNNTYEGFNSKICYGLLANSHSWTKKKPVADQVFNIMEKMLSSEPELDYEKTSIYPDVICISDTVTICFRKRLFFKEEADESELEMLEEMDTDSALSLSYDAYWSDTKESWLSGTVHGTLISYIIHRMAYANKALRNLATYFINTDISALSVGRVTNYAITLDDFVVRNYFDEGGPDNYWNPWGKNL